MKSLFSPLSTLTIALLGCLTSAHAQELRATLEDQKEVAVTIYNDNLALVKDMRRLTLPTGAAALAFRDVSAKMRPGLWRQGQALPRVQELLWWRFGLGARF